MRKTRADRRISIVQDAIQQLKIGIYVSTPRTYVHLNKEFLPVKLNYEDDTFVNPSEGAKEILLGVTEKETCQVCAKGALLLSCIRKENDFPIGLLEDLDYKNLMIRLSKGDLFSKGNLDLIERYYEGWINKKEGSDESDKYTKNIAKFYDKYPGTSNSEKRLFSIFRNMLKNDGIFKPNLGVQKTK